MTNQEFSSRVKQIVDDIIESLGGSYRGRGPCRGFSALDRNVGRSRGWSSQVYKQGKWHTFVLVVGEYYPQLQDDGLLEMAEAVKAGVDKAGMAKLQAMYKSMRGERHEERVRERNEKWKLSLLVATYPSPYPGKPLEGLC